MRDERRRVIAMLANAEPRGQRHAVLLANGVAADDDGLRSTLVAPVIENDGNF